MSKIDFSIQKIMELLPHRFPFLLIDKVVDITENNITAIKNVTINEPFFVGHFPNRPVMPGVLIIEAMAQTSGIYVLNKVESFQKKVFFFLTIDNAKFRIPVVPGDVLEIYSEFIKSRDTFYKFACEARVENKVVAEAVISAKVVI